MMAIGDKPAFKHFLMLPTSWSMVVVTEISQAILWPPSLKQQINALLAVGDLLFNHTAEAKRFCCLLDALLHRFVLLAAFASRSAGGLGAFFSKTAAGFGSGTTTGGKNSGGLGSIAGGGGGATSAVGGIGWEIASGGLSVGGGVGGLDSGLAGGEAGGDLATTAAGGDDCFGSTGLVNGELAGASLGGGVLDFASIASTSVRGVPYFSLETVMTSCRRAVAASWSGSAGNGTLKLKSKSLRSTRQIAWPVSKFRKSWASKDEKPSANFRASSSPTRNTIRV